MSDVLSAAEITALANLSESSGPFDKTFDKKLNRIVSRASKAIGAAISTHEHACRRTAVMKKMKMNFMNEMKTSKIGISDFVIIAVFNFWESVEDYDEATAIDKSMMGKIWDAMAKSSEVADVVSEFANKKKADKEAGKTKEEEKKEKEEEKKKKTALVLDYP